MGFGRTTGAQNRSDQQGEGFGFAYGSQIEGQSPHPIRNGQTFTTQNVPVSYLVKAAHQVNQFIDQLSKQIDTLGKNNKIGDATKQAEQVFASITR